MDDLEVARTDDNSLARLMDLGRRSDAWWSPEELGAILRHQLAAPLDFDLVAAGDAAPADRCAGCAGIPPTIRTFGDLLFQPHPPVELLERVKEFAKSCRTGTERILPDEIATVMYTLSIVAAMTNCDRRITQLDDQALRHLLDWVGEQTWLDGASRQLIESAREIAGSA